MMRSALISFVVLALCTPASAHSTSDPIDRVIRNHTAALRLCFQRELARKPDLGRGKVVVRFTIERGRVTRAAVTKTTLNDATVERCVVREIETLKFPVTGEPATVTYPFMFSAG